MTCPSPSARTCRTPRRPAAGTAAAGVRFENRHSLRPLCVPHSQPFTTSHFPLLFHPPPTFKPHLAVGQRLANPTPLPPRSQDHQVYAQHNKFGTFLVPKDSMNTIKEPAADAAAVTTKMAAKIAAKQVAAEATKEVAEDAAPAKATKEEAPVQIWSGLISDSGPPPGWALLGRLTPHTAGTPVAPVASRGGRLLCRAFSRNA